MPGSSHGKTRQEVLEFALNLVPEAKAVRSHNLFQDSTVLDLYVEYGLRYDLSLLEYQNPQLRPFRYWNGLQRIPYNFEDDIACIRGDGFELLEWMKSTPVLICDFHPIHVYLNTNTMERYATLRDCGHLATMTEEDVAPFVNHHELGIRSLFLALLEAISCGIMTPVTVSDLMQMDLVSVERWATQNWGGLSTHHAPLRTNL